MWVRATYVCRRRSFFLTLSLSLYISLSLLALYEQGEIFLCVVVNIFGDDDKAFEFNEDGTPTRLPDDSVELKKAVEFMIPCAKMFASGVSKAEVADAKHVAPKPLQ